MVTDPHTLSSRSLHCYSEPFGAGGGRCYHGAHPETRVGSVPYVVRHGQFWAKEGPVVIQVILRH
jgi:hypothetical protein